MIRKNLKRWALVSLALLLCLNCGCGGQAGGTTTSGGGDAQDWLSRDVNIIDDNYRTYYEIFVYSFCDSNGDGIGDLNGVTEKLDYIADLGFNGIWLMPIMPSPTYHKYDTTDYMNIDPAYGTLEDFKTLIAECHKRGINVIIDLALNHSSSEHPWFQAAVDYLKTLPDGETPDPAECPYVEYYNFNLTGGSGYETITGSLPWYYECQFWGGMPDLNLQNPAVRAEFEQVASFWLDLGVDGFRLDAVKEYVSGAVGTNVEILTWFNDYVKSVNADAYIVCECWENKETYAQYYASGVNSMFDFAFGDSSGVIAKVVKGSASAAAYGEQIVVGQELYSSYNADYIDASFYVNHDMGRSAGFYAGENSEAQTKMGNAMNILMSGSVFVYYGEELGMKGSGKDENKRVAMYWSTDDNAEGMCDGPADADDVKMKFGSLEEQAADENSIYSYVKRAILLRNQNPAIARGEVSFYADYSGESICVITKTYGDTELLLVFNTTAEAATVDLTGLNIQGTAVSGLTMLGQLLTGTDQPALEGCTLTMPAYSIAVYGLE